MSDQPSKPVEYRLVDGHPGYRVGDDGSVWSCFVKGSNIRSFGDWRRMKYEENNNGYLLVSFYNKGKRTQILVSHVVLISFGFAREGLMTRHLNGNPKDNRLCNLKWGTRKENSDDKLIHGTMPIGQKHWNVKLTDDDVHRIRYGDLSSLSNYKAADILKVSESTVRAIRKKTARIYLP